MTKSIVELDAIQKAQIGIACFIKANPRYTYVELWLSAQAALKQELEESEMTKSIVELAKECGAIIVEGDIVLTQQELEAFADALLKQEMDGREAVGYVNQAYLNPNYGSSSIGHKSDEHRNIPLFTRPPITSQRELELLAEIEKLNNHIKYLEANL